jgi:hypothetical protein
LTVEHPGSGVRREAKDFAARDSSKASSAVDEEKAERLHTRDPIGIGAFARARLWGGQGRMQLKAAEQLVGKDRELLPGAISAVVIGGNDLEAAARRHDVSIDVIVERAVRFYTGPIASRQ